MKKYFLSLLAVILAVASYAGLDAAKKAPATGTTIGLTQEVDATAKTIGKRVFTGMNDVTLTEVIGSAITKQGSKTPSIDGTQYTAEETYRKSVNSYDNQFVGYDIAVASGKKINFSHVNARIDVCDDTYNWYVEITDANGVSKYKSEEQTTTKTASALLSEDINVTGLTGTVHAKLWMKQGGSTKYFTVDQFTLVATTEADTRTTHKVTVSVTPEDAATTTPAVGDNDVIEGSDAVLTATPKAGYKFLYWEVDNSQVEGNPYTIKNVTANHTAVAHLEKNPVITFARNIEGVYNVNRMFINSVNTVEKGDGYVLPQNYLYYKEGYTLVGYNDGSKTYKPGETLTVNGDVTLTPVFEATPYDLTALSEATDVVVDFKRGTNGNRYINIEGNEDKVITNATINGKTVDFAINVNCLQDAGIEGSKGKLNNTSDEVRAQMNKGTKITIPAVKDMVVKVDFTNGDGVDALQFAGEVATEISGKSISYTYTGSASTLDIIDLGKSIYPACITITYPKGESKDPEVIDAFGTKSTEPLALEAGNTYNVDAVQEAEFYTFQSAYDCQVTITPDVIMNLMVTKANFVMDEEGYNEDYEDEKTFKAIGGGLLMNLDEFDDPFGGPEPQIPSYTWTAKAGVKYYVVAMTMGKGTFTVTVGDPVIPAPGTVIENPIDLSKTSVTWDVVKNPLDGDSFYTYTAPKDGEVTITFNGWITEELYVGEEGFFDPFTLPDGPEYQGEISGKCNYADAVSTFTFAVEEGVTYCITPGYMYVYDEAKPIIVSAKFTIPGVYGQLIQEMDAIDERLKALDKEFDADKRAQLKLTEMWARIQDQIYYEQRFLEHDMINVENPTNLQLALHKTRIAMINVSINSFETAAHIHANKDKIMKGIYEALLNLISSRNNMAAQYSIPADDAQWNSICARIDAQERIVNALNAAEGEPSAEEIAACEAEMSSIEAAMEAFAAKMESGATAIHSATATANDANIYNVAGQKTSANYRGIVIKNGKKMMVK